MLTLTVSNNTKRKTIVISGSKTVAEAFAQANIDASKGLVSLDGMNIPASKQANSTLNDLGAVDGSTLMSIIKNDNAR